MTTSTPTAAPAPPQHAATSPLRAVVGADLLAPLGDGSSTRYANLDYAASAPPLASVVAAVQEFLPTYASVHRGAGYASAVSTQAYEAARRVVADFVGARLDDYVVFVRNTTDALNLLASVVPSDLDVVCLDSEHHANLLPWQRRGATVVETAGTVDETLDNIAWVLERGNVGLVAVTGASNVTGEVLPLARIARLAHRYGARLAVDAAQLAPHRAIDIASAGVDYVAFSGHKLYAPFGAGALVGRADWLDAARPYLAGGGATASVTKDQVRWHTGLARHEAGSPNVVGAVAIAAACTALTEALPEARLHEEALVGRLRAGLDDIEGTRQLRIWSDDLDAVGIVTFTLAGVDPRSLAEYLSHSHGIGVRDGKFCAHRLLDAHRNPHGAIRASVGLGSSSDDVERLLDAVAAFASGER